jgi:hypothetical protein
MCVVITTRELQQRLDWHIQNCGECAVQQCLEAALCNEVIERRQWEQERKQVRQLVWMPGGDPS